MSVKGQSKQFRLCGACGLWNGTTVPWLGAAHDRRRTCLSPQQTSPVRKGKGQTWPVHRGSRLPVRKRGKVEVKRPAGQGGERGTLLHSDLHSQVSPHRRLRHGPSRLDSPVAQLGFTLRRAAVRLLRPSPPKLPKPGSQGRLPPKSTSVI